MAQQRYCPIHNVPLDPSWEVCPYCLKEGRVPPPPGALGPTVPMGPAPPPPLEQFRGPGVTARPGGPAPMPAAPAMPGDMTRPAGGMPFPDVTRRAGPPVDETRPAPGPAVSETVLERPPEARAWLVAKEGEGAGQWYPISEELAIGRDRENNVVLVEPKVSRFHAKIRLEKNEQGEEQFVAWDLASKNGTFVNDQRIRAPTPLKENDTIRVGTTTFVLKIVQ